jgi:hypothetical protein
MRQRQKDITDVGAVNFAAAHAEYAAHNIDLNRVPRRGWRLYGIGTGAGPTCLIVWGNLANFVEDHTSIITTFERRRAGIE